MHTFAQKPKVPQQTTPLNSTILHRGHIGHSREVESILHLQRTVGNQAVQQLLQATSEKSVSDPLPSASSRFAHDFSQVPIHNEDHRADSFLIQEQSVLRDQSGGGAPTTSPAPSAVSASSPSVSVDRIDIVDSPAGAISGYPPVTSGNLNSPGPFNNPATGGVSNVHQIHFHLDQGLSSAVAPRRELQRSAWIAGVEHKNPPDRPLPPGNAGPPTPGGFNGVIVGPDGPPAHEVKRPTVDKVVVADAPGAASLSAAQFPFAYKSHFTIGLTAGGRDIARVAYDVIIEKTNAGNVPNKQNSITAVSKEDLVRGQSLA